MVYDVIAMDLSRILCLPPTGEDVHFWRPHSPYLCDAEQKRFPPTLFQHCGSNGPVYEYWLGILSKRLKSCKMLFPDKDNESEKKKENLIKEIKTVLTALWHDDNVLNVDDEIYQGGGMEIHRSFGHDMMKQLSLIANRWIWSLRKGGRRGS